MLVFLLMVGFMAVFTLLWVYAPRPFAALFGIGVMIVIALLLLPITTIRAEVESVIALITALIMAITILP
ncbi:MAG: hypothetical protein M1334_03820 [Patescibacteria group bacterium]|nr:hypothetical protein [Patescibacteria group bacterium]